MTEQLVGELMLSGSCLRRPARAWLNWSTSCTRSRAAAAVAASIGCRAALMALSPGQSSEAHVTCYREAREAASSAEQHSMAPCLISELAERYLAGNASLPAWPHKQLVRSLRQGEQQGTRSDWPAPPVPQCLTAWATSSNRVIEYQMLPPGTRAVRNASMLSKQSRWLGQDCNDTSKYRMKHIYHLGTFLGSDMLARCLPVGYPAVFLFRRWTSAQATTWRPGATWSSHGASDVGIHGTLYTVWRILILVSNTTLW